MNAHQRLCEGLNVLERHGWKQAGDGKSTGRCIHLALRDADEAEYDDYQASTVLCDMLGFTDIDGVCDLQRLFDWNDHPNRTYEQVKALLVEAIAETAPPPRIPFVSGEAECVPIGDDPNDWPLP